MQLLGCSFDPRQVGLFVWGKLPTEVSGSEKIVNDLLEKARVFLTPGFIFGSNGERFIRISLGASVEKIQEAYRRIEEYLGNS
jgi:LL-diaminopimelate aminotransferase